MSDEPGSQEIAAGRSIAHYSILAKLGSGGMGDVYLGHDTRLDRKVAIKVLPSGFGRDSGRMRRFELEARALAALSHPNIVSVHSIEEHGPAHFLVMEFVEGETLRHRMTSGSISVESFFEIAMGLCAAMQAAHARGVMHRDLKPENVMITPSGQVKVLDFGLAKFRRENVRLSSIETRFLDPNLTTEGILLGTAPYMSPEQAEGRTLDHRSDLFSLGIVFYEMLTGAQPFRGRSLAQVLSAILRDEPAVMSSSRPNLPIGLDDIVLKCLRKDPEERFSSADDLHQSLVGLRRRIESGEATVRSGAAASTPERGGLALHTRWGLTGVLAALWAINWVETNAEELWSVRRGDWVGYDLAAAFSWFEGSINFEGHDAAGPVAVYLGSVAYFFLPVVLLALTLGCLVPRKSLEGYRLFTLAIVICYALSLPFYLLVPVPERWAFPGSQAVLLSDLWSTRLIETIRPMSGLDNCFPSFHVSGTFALVLVWYRLKLRFRHAVACLGGAVAISTLLLGIHWVADIVAGFALAFISLCLASWASARVTASRI